MKIEDYRLIEQTLQNVLDEFQNMNELVDTSYNKESSYENEKDVFEWNMKLQETLNNLEILKAWLIFTFEIEAI